MVDLAGLFACVSSLLSFPLCVQNLSGALSVYRRRRSCLPCGAGRVLWCASGRNSNAAHPPRTARLEPCRRLVADAAAGRAKRFINRTGLRAVSSFGSQRSPSKGRSPSSHLCATAGASTRRHIIGHRRAGRSPWTSYADRRFALAERRANNGKLSWTGRALHADHVRGYPASLGCIRLPSAFARLLDGVAGPGTLVILAHQRTEPVDVVHSGTLFPAVPIYEAGRLVRTVAVRSMPELLARSPESGHVAIVVSRSGGNAILLRDGLREHIARVTFTNPDRRIGTHVYYLQARRLGHELVWLAFGIGRNRREPHLVSWRGDEILDQVSFEDRAEAMAMARLLHTGATLVITDDRATGRKHQSPEGFVLISTQGSEPQQPSRHADGGDGARVSRGGRHGQCPVNAWR